MKSKLLRRMCRKCSEMFLPSGQFCKICDECKSKINYQKGPKRYYFNENDYLTEQQPETHKYKTVYKKGRCLQKKKSSLRGKG